MSLEEAKYRLGIQPEISDLNSILLLDSRKDFAGMYIQHKPVYRIYVFFKNQKGRGNHGNTGEIQRRLAGTSWRSFVKIRKVGKSLEELKEAQNIASDISRQLNISASFSINISRNQVEISVTDKSEFEMALSVAGLTLPNDVLILEVDALSETEANGELQAGLELVDPILGKNCSSGFAVKNAAGEVGILTAGHCKNDLQFGGLDMEFQSEALDGPYDVQWHKAHRFTTVVNEVRTCTIFGSDCGAETIIGAYANLPAGGYVCKYGYVTGKTCSFINSTKYLPPPSFDSSTGITHYHTATFVSVRGHISDHGDSGGPWFSEGFALGVHSGGTGGSVDGVSYYMPIQDISVLGVSVLTQ